MNWEKSTINLGFVEENTKINFKFVASKDLEIISYKPGCGSCTFIKGFKDGELNVTFVPGKVPVHLISSVKAKGFLEVRKTITVKYKDGKEEILSFLAKITKK